MTADAAAQIEVARLESVRRYAILDTPPDGAFDRICRLAARLFAVPMATVTIVDEDRIWFKARHGVDVTEIPREPGLCASAILDDVPFVMNDCVTDPRAIGNSLVHGGGVRFYASAPIVTDDGHRLGTVNVLDTRPRIITKDDEATLTDLAGVVMDELELRLAAMTELQRERERRHRALEDRNKAQALARTLQQTLSPPSLPRIPGLDLAAWYQPFAAEEVGGDFYDVFPLCVARTGFFLGDVCGKGAAAASMTSLARYTLRTAALLQEEPAAVLSDLNAALLLEDASDSRMCTAAFGEIDARVTPARLTVAIAGHPAPMLCRADGSVEMLDARGTILGAVAETEHDSITRTVEPGDTLLLYSDGILDLLADGRPVDEGRLADHLGEGAPFTSAQQAVERLRDVLTTTSVPVRDDIAILALRIDGAAAA